MDGSSEHRAFLLGAIGATLSAPWPALTYAALRSPDARAGRRVLGDRRQAHTSGREYVRLRARLRRLAVEHDPADPRLLHPAVGGILLVWSPAGALFAFGASALMLVFIGIHNARDTVMYVTTQLPSASSRCWRRLERRRRCKRRFERRSGGADRGHHRGRRRPGPPAPAAAAPTPPSAG